MSAKGGSGLYAAVDVGTSKMCCLIARGEEAGGLRVVGIGHNVARGIEGGSVVDMEAAEATLAAAVQSAERMAGERIESVVVNVSAGRPTSQVVGVEVAVGGHEIGERDIRRVLQTSRGSLAESERTVVQCFPVGYTVDGANGIRDPRGMVGERLGVTVHVVNTASGALRNLEGCIGRSHLDVRARVATPYASALATLVDDEKDLGVTVVDMGAGTTSAAVFLDGACVHTEIVPIGGHHVTNDIARVLSTPPAHAERMKTLYGSAVASRDDDREVIDVPALGEGQAGGANHIPRSLLVSIIRPRVEETLEMVRNRIEAAGLHRSAGRRLVLTGGASLLQGTRELAGQIFGKQVRVGQPIWLKGLNEAMSGPSFATCAGLLRYAQHEPGELVPGPWVAQAGLLERFGRFGQWLKENL